MFSPELLNFVQTVGPFAFSVFMGGLIAFTYAKVDTRRRINKDEQRGKDAELDRTLKLARQQSVEDTRRQLNELYRQMIDDSKNRERMCTERIAILEKENDNLESRIDDLEQQITKLIIENNDMKRQINQLWSDNDAETS